MGSGLTCSLSHLNRYHPFMKLMTTIKPFQVAHFLTPFNYDTLETVHAALNGLLPPDIRVREISAALPDFHARFSVKSKIYLYRIYNDTIMDPFHRLYAYHSLYKLNTSLMREAAKHFIGRHDFSAFANASRNDRLPDPFKTIFRFDIIEMVIFTHHSLGGLHVISAFK